MVREHQVSYVWPWYTNWLKYSLTFCAVPSRTPRKELYGTLVEKSLDIGSKAPWVPPCPHGEAGTVWVTSVTHTEGWCGWGKALSGKYTTDP